LTQCHWSYQLCISEQGLHGVRLLRGTSPILVVPAFKLNWEDSPLVVTPPTWCSARLACFQYSLALKN
jgi:hypothetical protein